MLTYGEMRTRAERIADEKLKDSVLAGLKALQDKWGDEWVEKIDCETLDLRDSSQCVLGQVCGWYTDGLFDLTGGHDWKWGAKHGFDLDTDPPDIDADEAWDNLDHAWHIVLCTQTD